MGFPETLVAAVLEPPAPESGVSRRAPPPPAHTHAHPPLDRDQRHPAQQLTIVNGPCDRFGQDGGLALEAVMLHHHADAAAAAAAAAGAGVDESGGGGGGGSTVVSIMRE
eukprot:COSAG01_NODE_1722_length_9386_cov_6.717562_8_plen_110_part_00